MTQSPPFTCSVPLLSSLHWLPVNLRAVFQDLFADPQDSSWKTTCLSSVYGLITPFPFTEIKQRNHSVSSYSQDRHRHKGISFLCLFALEQPPSPTTNCSFSHTNCNLQATSQNASFWLGISPHRYQDARWPVDVMKLLHWFCCWTLFRLSRLWTFLWWVYWSYRNFIDWLIQVHYISVNAIIFGRNNIVKKRVQRLLPVSDKKEVYLQIPGTNTLSSTKSLKHACRNANV